MGLQATARIRAVFLLLPLLLCGSAHAAAVDADLALVLAVDVSRSMDFDELKLQRDGYAAAFRHPDVLAAIADGVNGRIAVTYVEWAGPGFQSVVVPWAVIAGRDDAEAFAAKIDAAPLTHQIGTSISAGLDFAASAFDSSGVKADRRDIDVSGDGPNNAGEEVDLVRDRLVARGITINGLPIMLKAANDLFSIPDLDVYYEDCVIGGPGAFAIPVRGTAGFAEAIRRKLVLEISGLPPHLMAAAEGTPAPRVDCLIGEQLRRRLFDVH